MKSLRTQTRTQAPESLQQPITCIAHDTSYSSPPKERTIPIDKRNEQRSALFPSLLTRFRSTYTSSSSLIILLPSPIVHMTYRNSLGSTSPLNDGPLKPHFYLNPAIAPHLPPTTTTKIPSHDSSSSLPQSQTLQFHTHTHRHTNTRHQHSRY